MEFDDRCRAAAHLFLSPMRNLAIFGGTFNPVHWGHLWIAELAVSQFNLDQVFWVPTHQPPHKSQAIAQFEHRLAMVQQAIAGNPCFLASDIDADRSGPSYAIDTFQSLKARYSDPQNGDQWHWIIGQDAFCSLPKWRGIEAMAADCIWLVAPRHAKNSDAPVADAPVAPSLSLANDFDRSGALRHQWIETPTVGISSSQIRHFCQQERSIRDLVPESVRHYIQTHRLFEVDSLIR